MYPIADEKLFIIGILLAAVSAVTLVIFLVASHIRAIKLSAVFDKEYGEAEDEEGGSEK